MSKECYQVLLKTGRMLKSGKPSTRLIWWFDTKEKAEGLVKYLIENGRQEEEYKERLVIE